MLGLSVDTDAVWKGNPVTGKVTASLRKRNRASGKVNLWLLRGGVSPYSLSVRDSRLLVTPLNSKELRIYNSERQLRKRIALPRGLEPRHAVETGHRTVIVCHYGRRNGTEIFQLGEFDGAGNVLKIFCGEDDLNDFTYACLDLSGRALVVDSWNSRVILLNKDLQLNIILVS